MTRAETLSLTLLALVAFAANSLLTRLGLAAGLIDAASFTSVRLASGAVMLAVLVRLGRRVPAAHGARDWVGPLALFLYAAPFSFAYMRIGAAVGALVLFGVMQVTMIGRGIVRGERASLRTAQFRRQCAARAADQREHLALGFARTAGRGAGGRIRRAGIRSGLRGLVPRATGTARHASGDRSAVRAGDRCLGRGPVLG